MNQKEVWKKFHMTEYEWSQLRRRYALADPDFDREMEYVRRQMINALRYNEQDDVDYLTVPVRENIMDGSIEICAEDDAESIVTCLVLREKVIA